MDLMSIIRKVVDNAPLEDAEREFLRNCQLPETPGVSPPSEEVTRLQSAMAELSADRDRMKDELDSLHFRRRVDELAESSRFMDRDYLEYLCRKNQIPPEDESAKTQFIEKLRAEMPRFFRCELAPGAVGADPPSGMRPPAVNASIEDLLTLAPQKD